ncbi:MAG: DUF4917 family protein [Gaiellaceae bacterium]
MPSYHPSLDNADLHDWDAIRATDVQWRGLLLGNGASIAVAESFAYSSLYEVSQDPGLAHPLPGPSLELFEQLGTKNFEFVLGSLRLAARVCEATGVEASLFPNLYEEIQLALFEAVGHVHVPWEDVVGRTLPRIRAELLHYRRVFSTNYDLLVYWAIMCEADPNDFRDFFWDPTLVFDSADVEVWGRPSVVHFLHGGVHLRRHEQGRTSKRRAVDGNLLTQFATDWASDQIPLLVSEGTSDDKLRSITGSDYLTFCYSNFARHKGNLVVFGHGLGQEDAHITHAINQWDSPPWDPRQIAISIRPQLGEEEIRREKARLVQRLPRADLWFFDADSHPLGAPNVRVQV